MDQIKPIEKCYGRGTEWSPPAQVVRGSNPGIRKFYQKKS